MNLHFLKGLALWYFHRPSRINKYIENNDANEKRIREKNQIIVVFFASNVSMWKYQGLYNEMIKHPRYKIYIILSPLKNASLDTTKSDIQNMREYFDNKGIRYKDFNIDKFKGFDVKVLNPDLIFYPQPYYTVMSYRPHRYYKFNKSLLGYIPYGYNLRRGEFICNEDFHNRAWKRFYENEYVREDCKLYSAVGDRNVEITGHAIADMFITANKDVWKHQETRKKRIIWAPHFTIFNDGWSQNTMFIEIAELMIEIAEEYQNQIQIAFKPHPKLLSELYRHPLWGKDKADAYYKKWDIMENSQLETGEYSDLFMSSDAMIHDSGSFAAEYMYTGNPVMYTNKDMSVLFDSANELGKRIYEMHYVGTNEKDIKHFIKNIVLNGDDPLKEERERLCSEHMLPPNGKRTAENVMDVIINCLGE